jgi:signal transduction histidine kinase
MDVVSDGSLDPKMLSALMADESHWQILFERVPTLLQLAIYDDQKWVRAWARPGTTVAVDPLQDKDTAALLAERQMQSGGGDFVGRTTVMKNGRYFAIATTGNDQAPRATVLAELDVGQLFKSAAFGQEGRALLVDFKTGRPRLAADEAERVRRLLPGLDRLLAQRPENGETADVDDGHGRRYRIYAAVSAETSRLAILEGVGAVALMPIDEIYAPLARIRLRVLASVAATLVLAFLAAFLLSGRFVADIERIRSAVAAFAQGDWRRLEKSSRDELGGSLVDSINDMTTAVAERMRRDEAESWRSLVRVVSHEINNTLAPIRSVATSLRSGLEKRLRENDAGADVDMALELIVERVDALATFIDGYAEVAKLPQPDRRLTDVERLVTGATTLFAEEAERRGVALDVRAADVGAVELDAQQMERVLVNLVKNALEASPRGSAVDVMAGRVAGGLEILVADAGPGISPEARRNLFVPYFTTKPGGSGIGLALARQIVVAHGGTITAERSPSGGTLMRVLFPDVARSHPYREVG